MGITVAKTGAKGRLRGTCSAVGTQRYHRPPGLTTTVAATNPKLREGGPDASHGEDVRGGGVEGGGNSLGGSEEVSDGHLLELADGDVVRDLQRVLITAGGVADENL